MADTDLSSQEAIDFFQNLQIPFPVYKPVEGQLKKDIEYALERLEQCSSAVGADIGLQLKIAYGLLCLDRRDEAAAVFQQIKDATGSIRVRVITCIERGILLGQKSELVAGIRLAEEHPAGDEDDHFRLHIVERGKYELGRLHYQEGDFTNAARYLEAGLNVLKDGFEAHYALGVSHARIGGYSKAVEHLKACLKLRESSDVYHELGDTYIASANYREAVQAFVESARIAGQVDRFAAESYKWWCAGAVAAERCHDHEQAAQYLVLSLKAALKVQDPETQARRLMDASTWLNICIRANLQGKPLDQLLQDTKLERVTHKESQQEPLKTMQAEAYGTLGIAMLTYQSFDDARGLLRNAISLLTQQEGSLAGNRERLLLFRFQWAEAVLYSVLHEHEMALHAFQESKSVAPTERDRLLCEIRSCYETKQMGDFLTAATMLANLEVENASLLETEWELKAELLLGLGQSLLGVGNAAQASVHLEAAKSLLEDRGCYTSDLLPLTYAMLYTALIQNGFFPRAFDLIGSFHALLSAHHKESDHEQLLHLFAACTSRMLVDNEASKDTLTELLEQPDVKDPRLKCAALAALADAYRNQEDYEAAETKYKEAMSLIRSDDALLYSQLYISRAGLYRSKAVDAELNGKERDGTMELNRKALCDYEQAIRILEESKVLPLDLANAYAGQAVVLLHIDDYEAAARKLDRAMDLAGNNELLRAKIKRVRAHILLVRGEFEQAIREAREAAFLFAEVQVKLQHLESAWVTLLEGDMRHLFFLLQTAWVVGRQSFRDALLWAERGRMRLYFHLADRRLVTSDGGSLLDPLAFDRDDGWAIGCITDAVKGCGPGCVVVEYTYSPIRTKLYIFVAMHEPGLELAVECKPIDLTDFFSKQQNRAMGATLDALIRRTRTEIKRKAEDKAKAGLGVLYRLLLQPVLDMVDEHGADTILFAPSGSVWLVPFAALYDETSSQFLVEKKKVGVIPSLRALQRCQARHEDSVKLQQCREQAAGFVAGDPEPMGLSCGQLGGARQEAIDVAKQLGVAPLIGRQMTKGAVIEGLQSNCAVVTLVTHGVVDALYPHGALVMQGKQQQQQQKKMSNRAVDIDRLALRSNLVPRQSSNMLEQSSDVLTASEIEKLDVHAALVVLSACQTGEGEVPSEGLLGLARAVLQAGTSCAVVTLWRVDDDATKQLMTGMFRDSSNKQTVAEALRLSMLSLLHSEAPVYKWASAAAVGFPMLKMMFPAEICTPQELPPVAGQADNGGLSPGTPMPNSTSHFSPPQELAGQAEHGCLTTMPSSNPTAPRPKRKNWFCRCCCCKA